MPFDGNSERYGDNLDDRLGIRRAVLAKMWGCSRCWRLRFDPRVVPCAEVAVNLRRGSR